MKVVIDTNVLVSGLLSPAGPPGRIVDLVTTGAINVPTDDRLPDPHDLPFLEVAAAGGAETLITGNDRHSVPLQGRPTVPVKNPARFLDHWRKTAGGR